MKVKLILEGDEIFALTNALVWQKIREAAKIKSLTELINEQPDRPDRAAAEQLLKNAQNELEILERIHRKLRKLRDHA